MRTARLAERLEEAARGELAAAVEALNAVRLDLDRMGQRELDALAAMLREGKISREAYARRMRWATIGLRARLNARRTDEAVARRERVVEVLEQLGSTALRLLGGLL